MSIDALDPDQVHTPGIYVQRVVHNPSPRKLVEHRTVRVSEVQA